MWYKSAEDKYENPLIAAQTGKQSVIELGEKSLRLTARTANVDRSLTHIKIALTAFAVLSMIVLGLAQPAAAQGPASVADLAERLTGAVVNISTTQKVSVAQRNFQVPELPEGSPFKDFFKDLLPENRNGRNGGKQRSRKTNSLGSGFVIDAKGIIITNNHVIADADEIKVIFSDGEKLEAKIIGRDSKTDLAVLKVEPKKSLQAVKFGSSKKMRVGDWVMAIGNPFGLGGTVTMGIVSAIKRDISAGPYDNFIQTDAAINRGNSGGPLFNMDGEVVGINTAIISPSGGSIGIGFSVPSDTATSVVEQLIEFGETRRGWLGVRIQAVTDEIAEGLGLDKARGALVSEVTPNGPAEAGKLKSGDVILEFDGEDVPQMRDLPRIVADTAADKMVDVLVLRKGKEETLKVKIGRLEEKKVASNGSENDSKTEQSTEEQTVLGLTLAPLDKNLRTRFKIDKDVEGIVVTDVDNELIPEEKRIKPGDVVIEVDQQEVKSTGEIAKLVDKLKESGDRKTVILRLANQNGEHRFVALKLKPKS
jgi:serine protease Do